jgi:hypothetical protein
VNLGWRHQFGTKTSGAGSSEFFSGLFYRHGSLTYDPSTQDQPQFVFFPDTTPRNLQEHRTFNAYGIKADYTVRPADELEFKFGTISSLTRGHEDFSTFAANGVRDPHRTPI